MIRVNGLICAFLILSFGVITACGSYSNGFFGSRGDRGQISMERAEMVEKLVPEDGRVNRRKLDTVIQAITTVTKIPNRDIPEDAYGVRQTLLKLSFRDLREIDFIVSEAEAKRE
ncbi:MAG: hypothetical protein OEN50_14650 [Deltaproteobacteria bacterium]|nr:hypothetical protein [Deltaproteobacteria bacterium]